MKSIRVLIVDDHPVVRQGLCSLLGTFSDIEVIGEAASPYEMQVCLRQEVPDVVLLDAHLGDFNGIDAAQQLRRSYPNCRIIILTAYDNPTYLNKALEVGVEAYLLKDIAVNELQSTIRAAYAGDRLISPELMTQVLAGFQQLAEEQTQYQNGLLRNDYQILLLMAEGLTNRHIADELHVSEATIKKRVQIILEKLEAENRTQAVAQAIRNGII